MRRSNKGRRARHVIVIAGASGSGKTHLITKLSQPPHDAFTLNVLKQLGCDPNQRLKRSTVERMQRLMDPANFKKTKNTEAETLPAASYRSDEHQSQQQFEDVAADFKANQAARCDHPLHLTERMATTHL
jgi:uridine kinase